MKKLFFITLILSCLFSFGKCNKKKKCCKKKTTTEVSSKLNANEVWMQYNETKCENPWQFNWLIAPTTEQILGAIKGNLKGKGIDVLEIRVSREKINLICEECNCLNGIAYFVRINKSDIEKLKALKFYEVKNLPEIKETDTAK